MPQWHRSALRKFMELHSGQAQQSRMTHSCLSNSHRQASMDSGLSDELVAADSGPGTSNLTVGPNLLLANCGPGISNLTVPLGIFLGAGLGAGAAVGFALGIFQGAPVGLTLLE